MLFQKEYWERKELAKRRSPTHPAVAAYVIPKIDVIRRYINITGKIRLLDVGCGNGFFTFYFDKICDTCGIDYSEKMLRMNPVKKTFMMDAGNIEFKDNTFDMVFCHHVLHHVEDMNKVLQEMRRVSNRYVVILEPNRNNPIIFLYTLMIKEERKAASYSLSYLRNKVIRNGLRIVASFSYGMMVPNMTPAFLLPLVRLFNFRQPLGMTNFIIAEKEYE